MKIDIFVHEDFDYTKIIRKMDKKKENIKDSFIKNYFRELWASIVIWIAIIYLIYVVIFWTDTIESLEKIINTYTTEWYKPILGAIIGIIYNFFDVSKKIKKDKLFVSNNNRIAEYTVAKRIESLNIDIQTLNELDNISDNQIEQIESEKTLILRTIKNLHILEKENRIDSLSIYALQDYNQLLEATET